MTRIAQYPSRRTCQLRVSPELETLIFLQVFHDHKIENIHKESFIKKKELDTPNYLEGFMIQKLNHRKKI